MYREFGAQDKQAPVMEETKSPGQIQVQSSLDQEMTKMSPILKMSHLQSMMHFDESMESNVDSDLDDGEIRKLLTSQLCAQRASTIPDAMFIQEREVKAQTSHSSEGREATRRPVALLDRNQTWSSVFGNANVSNSSETPLEGNKGHSLKRARTDLARREIHVESLSTSASMIYKNSRRYKIEHYKKYNTKLLNVVENKLDYNSLLPHRSWCGRHDSKHKSQLVLIFRRQLCCGSKKWRWLILWIR